MTSENAIYTPAQGRLLEALLKAPARRVHNSGRLGDYTWWINGNAVTGQLHRAMLKGLVSTHADDPDTAVITAAGRAALAAPLALRSQGSESPERAYTRGADTIAQRARADADGASSGGRCRSFLTREHPKHRRPLLFEWQQQKGGRSRLSSNWVN